MSVINQKEYLKKYLSLGEEKDKKKKRKKKSQIIKDRVKIIDDDIDVPHDFNEKALNEFLTAEDAPQVVGIIDERPLSMRVDDYRKSDKWKLVGSDDELKETDLKNEKLSTTKQSKDDFKKRNNNWKSIESDNESKETDSKIDKCNKHSQRRKERYSPDNDNIRRKRRNSSDNDDIRRKRSNTSDNDDIRRKRRNSSDNDDIKRKRRNSSDNDDIKRKRGNSSDNDDIKRKDKYSPDDNNIRRKRRNSSEYDDIKRKRRNSSDNDDIRRKRRNSSDNDDIKRKNKYSLNNDKIRRKRSNSSDNDDIKKKNKYSPDDDTIRRKRRNSSDNDDIKRKPEHSIEYDRKISKKSSTPDITNNKKMTKTLDGKTAGLQHSADLKKETLKFKKAQDEIFSKMSADISGRNAAPVIRDRKTGKKRDFEQEAMAEFEKQEKEKVQKAKYDKWGKGLKQVEDQKQKIEEELYEMSKPLARYADDKDLEKYLRDQEREGDPMLQYIRKKRKKEAEDSGKPLSTKPKYEGDFLPNRFGIPPGHRWDGVDRSNGYEKQWFAVQNSKKAVEEDIYKWSTEDM